jgi:hypothetical protein
MHISFHLQCDGQGDMSEINSYGLRTIMKIQAFFVITSMEELQSGRNRKK